jgi:outer membrane protein assembly factor BamD (BamD/ComL family)
MGRKRVRKRKYFLCVVTILTCLAFIGCASIKRPEEPDERQLVTIEPIQPTVVQVQPKQEQQRDESKEHLLQGRQLLATGQYEASIKENLKVLSIAPNGPPGDEAMFTIGLIYANPKYQKKDFSKAVTSLTKVIKEYPQSRWSGQARILLDIIHENEKLKRVSTEANQENEKLKSVIEQSKKVDVEVEEKKREKAR